MRLTRLSKQTGLSLIEIMISLTIGLMLIGAASAIGLGSVLSGKEGIQQTNLHEALRSVMAEASRDLRRAGYSKDMDLSPQFRKIYLSQAATIEGKNTYQCVIFRYDNYDSAAISSGNGTFGSEDVFGLTFKNNQVFVLLNGAIGTTTCTGNEADGWFPINSANSGAPKISNFFFTVRSTPTVTKNTSTPAMQIGALAAGNITLYIRGQSAQGAGVNLPAFNAELEQTVQLRNLPVIQ